VRCHLLWVNQRLCRLRSQCHLLSALFPAGIRSSLKAVAQEACWVSAYGYLDDLPPQHQHVVAPAYVSAAPTVRPYMEQQLEALSGCLQQLAGNPLPAAASPTPMLLVVLTASAYLTLYEMAWATRDMDLLHSLLHHGPGADMWASLCGSAIDSAIAAASEMRKGKSAQPAAIGSAGATAEAAAAAASAAAAVADASLVGFLRRPVNVQTPRYSQLDSLADLDVEELGRPTDRVLDDGFGTSPSIANAGHRFRWALLEAVALQLVDARVRRQLEDAGVDVSDLSRGSPALAHALACCEGRLRRVEALLLTLDVPAAMQGGAAGGASYPASSLFKIRTLLEPSANPFRGIGARRLWYCLVNNELVQAIIEAVVFRSTAAPSGVNRIAEEGEGGEDNGPYGSRSTFQTVYRVGGGEVAALCANRAQDTFLAFANSKYLFEMQVDVGVPGGEDGSDSALQRSMSVLSSSSRPASRNNVSSSPQPGATPLSPTAMGAGPTGTGVLVTQQRPVAGVCRLAAHPSMPL